MNSAKESEKIHITQIKVYRHCSCSCSHCEVHLLGFEVVQKASLPVLHSFAEFF